MKAIFFDRDGIINKDFGYVHKQERFVFNDGLFDLLKLCKESGYLLLVITNQSGIARGLYTLKDFEVLTAYMQDFLQKILGFHFDSVYFCPHDPSEQCRCRKPNIGMIDQAKKDYDLTLNDCCIIGDKISDIQAGNNAGIRHKILVGKPVGANIGVFKNLHIVANLFQVADIIRDISKT